MAMAQCPGCQTMIQVGHQPVMGARIHCPQCGTDLEIVWLYPVELDLPEEVLELYQGELEST